MQQQGLGDRRRWCPQWSVIRRSVSCADACGDVKLTLINTLISSSPLSWILAAGLSLLMLGAAFQTARKLGIFQVEISDCRPPGAGRRKWTWLTVCAHCAESWTLTLSVLMKTTCSWLCSRRATSVGNRSPEVCKCCASWCFYIFLLQKRRRSEIL